MAKGQSLQEPFLNTLRREKMPVSIYLEIGRASCRERV